MKIKFNLSMRLILACLLAMPLRGLADIYIQQDNSQQIVLTNLAPDVASSYKTSNQGLQRFELLIESDFLEINKVVQTGNTPKINNDVASRKQIADAVKSAAAQTAIDPALIHAVIKVESNYNPKSLSRQGAQGLMQLMPTTARRFNVTNPYDPAQNVLAGAQYLRELHTLFNGNMPLILAAYNAGPMAVIKHHMRIPPFMETRLYVPKVLDLYRRMQAERTY